MPLSRFPIPQATLDVLILQILSLEKQSWERLAGAVRLLFEGGE